MTAEDGEWRLPYSYTMYALAAFTSFILILLCSSTIRFLIRDHFQRSKVIDKDKVSQPQDKKTLMKSRSKGDEEAGNSSRKRTASKDDALVIKEQSMSENLAKFKEVDKDNNGIIDKAELGAWLESIGQQIGEEDLDEFFEQCDLDGDGKIDSEEFDRILSMLNDDDNEDDDYEEILSNAASDEPDAEDFVKGKVSTGYFKDISREMYQDPKGFLGKRSPVVLAFAKRQAPLVMCPVLCGFVLAWHFYDLDRPLSANIAFKISTIAVSLVTGIIYGGVYWKLKPVNGDGTPVKLGQNGVFPGYYGINFYYCAREFPIPGSDGRCGPTAGPQCPACERYQAKSWVNKSKFYVTALIPRLETGFWFAPTLTLFIFFMLWGSPETDLHCGQKSWGPMIPWIASFYLPPTGSTEDQQFTDDLLAVSVFTPFPRKPDDLLPSMDHEIEGKLLRTRYFVFEIAATVFATCMILETVRWLCKGKHGSKRPSFSEPLMAKAYTIGAVSRGPSEQKGSKHFWIYRLMFDLWYIFLYQVLLYMLMDFGVAHGLMNLTTGIAWELWVPFIEMICFTALATGIPWYIKSRGETCEHPSILVSLQLFPWLGNELHIMKDHIAQALCFATAHCMTGKLRTVGLVLGYLSILSTFVPLPLLLWDAKRAKGLRSGHWTIPEAAFLVQGPKGQTKWAKFLIKANELMVGSCTEDKRIRALTGELPHAVIHINFAYFFGGGVFILVAIVLSVAKIVGIPLGRLYLQQNIPQYGCSEIYLDRFFSFGNQLSWGDESEDADMSIGSAFKYGWNYTLGLLRSHAPELNSIYSEDDAEKPSDGKKLKQLLLSVKGDADSYIAILRILHYRLGLQSQSPGKITVDLAVKGDLDAKFLDYVEELDKMSGKRNLGKYCEAMSGRSRNKPEVASKLKSLGEKLAIAAKAEKGASEAKPETKSREINAQGDDTGEKLMASQVGRVEKGLKLAPIVLPLILLAVITLLDFV